MSWARKAREEHRAFADGLTQRGVTVHMFRDVGRGAGDPRGPRVPARACASPQSVGPQLVQPLCAARRGCVGSDLASFMIGGILKDLQLPEYSNLLWTYLGTTISSSPAAEPPVPAGQHGVRLRRDFR